MTSFLLIAGLGSYLVVGLLCVAAFAIAGVAAYFYLRAKNREALDPAKGLVAGDSPVALGEMRELTSRIEEIVTTQQDHGETQRAHLSRKIDQVRESVEGQHHAVTGLRHELRHEIEKRDAEMHEIRHQIESVRDGLALPPAERPALPPGPSAADLGAPETHAAMSPVSFGAEPEDATFTETPADEAPAFDEMAFAPLDADEDSPLGLAFAFEEDDPAEPLAEAPPVFTFEDAAFEPAADAPAFEDAPDPLVAPVFAFEDDEPVAEDEPTEDDEPAPVFAFEEEALEVPASAPLPTEPETPTFSFEEDEPVVEDEPAAAPVFALEEEVLDVPASETAPPEAETPVFSFEEDEPVAEEPSEAFQVVSFLEPEDTAPEPEEAPAPETTAAEPPTPVFAFEGEAPEPTSVEAVPEVPVFSFEEDEPVAEAPDAATALAFEEEEPLVMEAADTSESADPPAEAEAPMALAFEEDMPMAGHVAMEAAQASVSETRIGASTVSSTPPPSPTFAPPLAAPSGDAGMGEAPPSAWISRPDRQPPETPVETIEGIAVERVGDVPPVEPAEEPAEALHAEPEADDPAPEPAPADEFPSPVVASELAVESFDFGIDIDAELEAAGQAPLDDPTAEPIRHAPVPPLRMEVPSPTAEAPEPATPEPIAPDSIATPPAASVPAPTAQEEPEGEVAPYVAPKGAEDLTIISSVDADTQRALHMAGVLTLDEIACWGRSDARRIASQVGVAEETIMHQWIFEAQSALFERYSRR